MLFPLLSLLPWPLLAAPRRTTLLLPPLPKLRPLLLRLTPPPLLRLLLLRPLLLRLTLPLLLRPLLTLPLLLRLPPLRPLTLPRSNWYEAKASKKGVLRHPFFIAPLLQILIIPALQPTLPNRFNQERNLHVPVCLWLRPSF